MAPRKKILFVDMDGTLYVYRQGVPKEALFCSEYYAGLPVMDGMPELMATISETAEIYICSAVLNDRAVVGKKEALKEHYGFIRGDHQIFVPYGTSKAEAAEKFIGRNLEETDVLLDDEELNLCDWQSHRGKGIKFLNGMNSGGKWKGKTMSMDGFVVTRPCNQFILDKDTLERLVYAIYERACLDIMSDDPGDKRKAAEFLKKDPYGFGTEEICRKMKIQ